MAEITWFLVIAFFYVNIGNLFFQWINYAGWYGTSWAAKILFPAAPTWENSPLSTKTPAVNQQRKSGYGTFENYNDSCDTGTKVIMIVFWPLCLVIPWAIAIYSWIVFFFCGGLLKVCRLTPRSQ